MAKNSTPSTEPALLSRPAAAAHLGIGLDTLAVLIDQGRLATVVDEEGDEVGIERDALDRL